MLIVVTGLLNGWLYVHKSLILYLLLFSSRYIFSFCIIIDKLCELCKIVHYNFMHFDAISNKKIARTTFSRYINPIT